MCSAANRLAHFFGAYCDDAVKDRVALRDCVALFGRGSVSRKYCSPQLLC